MVTFTRAAQQRCISDGENKEMKRGRNGNIGSWGESRYDVYAKNKIAEAFARHMIRISKSVIDINDMKPCDQVVLKRAVLCVG